MASFVDSGAVAKLYHQEPGTDEVVSLFAAARLTGESVYISQLTVVEVQSVFAKMVRTGLIDALDSDLSRKRFLYDLRRRSMKVIAIRTAHYEEAARLIRQHGLQLNLRTLDAIQLAVALDLRNRGLIDNLVTADRALCAVSQQAGLLARNPERP